jgi:hypothetical protein
LHMADRHGGFGIWDLDNCQYIIHLGCIVNFLSSTSLVSFGNNNKCLQWVWSNFSSNHWIRDSADVWCILSSAIRWNYQSLLLKIWFSRRMSEDLTIHTVAYFRFRNRIISNLSTSKWYSHLLVQIKFSMSHSHVSNFSSMCRSQFRLLSEKLAQMHR